MKEKQKQKFLLHPTLSLPILVMIDMFSVALVVPLLYQYYKTAGVTSANQRELLSSVFSSSQIVGGLALGAMADAGILKRKTILFVSFGGSALAYGLIIFGSIQALILSRILVGLVKQTMTVATTMLARYTTNDDRAKHMGRMNAGTMISWVLGPSVGGFLYKNVGTRAPALLASSLFMLNMVLATMILPHDDDVDSIDTADSGDAAEKGKKDQKNSSFISNLKACFSSRALGSVIISKLLLTWFMRATSYASMSSYYEEMYGMEPHQRGYLSSYQQALSFIVMSSLVNPILKFFGGERQAATSASLLMALATILELQGSLPLFLIVLSPTISLSTALIRLTLNSLVTQVTPKDSLGSVLAALDVLQNAMAVTVPFYRTFLFSILANKEGSGDDDDTMDGDPDPRSWLIVSAAHWVVAGVALGVLLLTRSSVDRQKEKVI